MLTNFCIWFDFSYPVLVGTSVDIYAENSLLSWFGCLGGNDSFRK